MRSDGADLSGSSARAALRACACRDMLHVLTPEFTAECTGFPNERCCRGPPQPSTSIQEIKFRSKLYSNQARSPARINARGSQRGCPPHAPAPAPAPVSHVSMSPHVSMSSEQAKCREFSVVANSILKSLEETPPTLDFVVIDEHLHDSTRSCTTAREFVDSIHRKNFALQRTAPMYRIIDQIRSTGVHKMVNAFKPINLSAFIHLPNDHTNGFMD